MSCLSKISCLAARRVLSSMSIKPFGVFVLSNLAGRISNLMWYSTKYIPYGTPPSETPLVESPEGKAALENAKWCKDHTPLFPVDIKQSQKPNEIEQRLDQIEKMFKELMKLINESNENSHGLLKQFIKVLNEQR